MDDILPPQNLEAEIAVLGAIILDGESFTKATVRADDFYKNQHVLIYRAMDELHQKGDNIDIVSIGEVLKREGKYEQIGGLAYLSQLAREVVTSANIKYHSDIVREHSQKRQIIRACTETMQGIHHLSVDEILSKLHNSTSNIVTGHGGDIVDMRDVALETIKKVEHRYYNKHSISGVRSGFRDMDELTDGFQPGEVYVIGARPGMGKTALSMAIAQNAEVPVGRIDLEMSQAQLGRRVLSSLSQMSLYKFRKGIIDKHEWPAVNAAVARMSQLPIFFSFLSYSTVEVERVITQMVETKGIKMLMVDYLQLINSAEKKKREQEVAEASRLMKRMAKVHNIPVIALAQLNREVEKRGDKRPTLADLRESGQIEQDADVIMFLYREDAQESSGPVEIIIAKGRDTGYAKISLYFDGNKMTFRDMEGKHGHS